MILSGRKKLARIGKEAGLFQKSWHELIDTLAVEAHDGLYHVGLIQMNEVSDNAIRLLPGIDLPVFHVPRVISASCSWPTDKSAGHHAGSLALLEVFRLSCSAR